MRVGYIQPFRGHGLCGFVMGCMVTLGRTINSSHSAKHKSNTIEPHANSCNLQRIWKNLAGRDEWLLGMRTVLQRTRPSNFTRISVLHVGHHTPLQLSPSEEGHGNSTPDGSTRLQKKRNCVDIIIGHVRNRTSQALHHTVKRSVWQLTREKQTIPPTTQPNKLLNDNHVTPIDKKRKAPQRHLRSANLNNNYSSNHSTVTQGTSPTNKLNWSTAKSPSDVRTRKFPMRVGHTPPFRGHGSCGFVNGCLSVTLGQTIMNSNHMAKHKR